MKKNVLIILFFSSFSTFASTHVVAADSIPVSQADVASIDGIITALYQCVSGGVGEKRNWDRMRTLFQAGSRLISTGKREGAVYKRDMTLEEYFSMAGPRLEKSGFFEIEVARKIEQYASIANLFSTYESRYKTSDEKPFARGINSIQLFNDGKRWWIVNIIWASESPTTGIPEKYLK